MTERRSYDFVSGDWISIGWRISRAREPVYAVRRQSEIRRRRKAAGLAPPMAKSLIEILSCCMPIAAGRFKCVQPLDSRAKR